MASFDSIVATTELEAINQLLATIGEAPLTAQSDIDTPTSEDVKMAVNAFKREMRKCLLKKWEFNTELNYRINPTVSNFAWTDADGTAQTLAIFLPPAGLLDFQVAMKPEQQGSRYLDTVVRIAKLYPTAPTAVLVFYDRAFNRDGFPASERAAIYIDAVWSLDFTDMPEVARQYIAVKAGRSFQRQVVGDRVLETITEQDELEAWKDLKKRHGLKTDLNFLSNADVYKHLGNRPRGASGFTDLRRGALGLF